MWFRREPVQQPLLVRAFTVPKRAKAHFRPCLNESQPLTLFYHAEKLLIRHVKSLQRTHCEKTFQKQLNHVHTSQKMLLDLIFVMLNDFDDDLRVPRDYSHRNQTQPKFSESVLFAAQVIHSNCGFTVRGLDARWHQQMQPEASELALCFERLRDTMRSRALENRLPPLDFLKDDLVEFDRKWVSFERKLCNAIHDLHTQQLDVKRQSVVRHFEILSKTIRYCLDKGYISKESIEEQDPELMYCIPRLVLLCSILFEDHATREENGWLVEHETALLEIQRQMKSMTPEHLDRLFQSVLDSESIRTPLYKTICAIGDTLHSNAHTSEFTECLRRVVQALDQA